MLLLSYGAWSQEIKQDPVPYVEATQTAMPTPTATPIKVWSTPTSLQGGQPQAIDGGNEVAPGDTITLSVSVATDKDHWKIGEGGEGKEGDEDDEIKYKWSSNSGFIGLPLPGQQEGNSTTWKAPKKPGIYTVTCLVDDKPKEIDEGDAGSRNDDAVTCSFEITVTRHWEKHTSIGQNGSGEDGVFLTPQNMVIAGGGTFNCQLSFPTDLDKWTAARGKEGFERDAPLHYQWEAPSGTTFFLAANVPFAIWNAPVVATATTFTIKCHIDDTPTPIAEGESGDRDDARLTRELQVRVVPVPSASNSRILLYKQIKNEQGQSSLGQQIDSSDEAGGGVYVVLEIKVGAHSRLKPGQRSVIVRVKDKWSGYKESEGEADLPFELAGSSGELVLWEKGIYHHNTQGQIVTDSQGQPTIDWQGEGTGSPLTENNGSEPTFYRAKALWDTIEGLKDSDSTLPSANGDHILYCSQVTGLSLTGGAKYSNLYFEKQRTDGVAGWDTQNAYASGPASNGIDVQNVAITNVASSNGTVDYFKWDPNSEDETLTVPTVTFKIKDLDESHFYRWVVYFQETREIHKDTNADWTSSAYRVSGVANSPQFVTVELTNVSIPGHLAADTHESGPYTYDIRVTEYESAPPSGSSEVGAIDRAQFKQPYTEWIPAQFVADGQTKPGHAVWTSFPEESANTELRANYYFYPNPETNSLGASDVKLIPIDPFLKERMAFAGEGNPGVLHGGDTGVVAYNITGDDPDGDWRVIFTGNDPAGPPLRREHDFSRMIPVNDIGAVRTMMPFSTFTQNNRWNASGWYAIWVDTARVTKKVEYHNNADPQQRKSVLRRIEELTGGRVTRLSPYTSSTNNDSDTPDTLVPASATSSTLRTYGREWAVLNGAFYSSPPMITWDNALPAVAVLGEVAAGGSWYSNPPLMDNASQYARYAFGIKPNYVANSSMGIAEMAKTGEVEGSDGPRPVYATPSAFKSQYPYGRSGLLSILQNGNPHVYRYNYTSEDNRTAYNNIWIDSPPGAGPGGSRNDRLSNWNNQHLEYYGVSRSQMHNSPHYTSFGWSKDGRHMFFVVQHFPDGGAITTRDLYAKYGPAGSTAKQYTGQGEVIQTFLSKYRSLQSGNAAQFNLTGANLPSRIWGAMMLDGGHSSSLMHRRYIAPDKKSGRGAYFFDSGSWLMNFDADGRGGYSSAPYPVAVTDTIEAVAR